MENFNHEIGTKFTSPNRKHTTFEIDSLEGGVWMFVTEPEGTFMEFWNEEEVKELELIKWEARF